MESVFVSLKIALKTVNNVMERNAPNVSAFTLCMRVAVNFNVQLHFMRHSIQSTNQHAFLMLCHKMDRAWLDAPNAKIKYAFHVLQDM